MRINLTKFGKEFVNGTTNLKECWEQHYGNAILIHRIYTHQKTTQEIHTYRINPFDNLLRSNQIHGISIEFLLEYEK